MWKSRRFGAHQANRWLTSCSGRLYKQDATQRAGIHSPGFQGTDLSFVTGAFEPEPRYYAENGIPVASYATDETWGNDTSLTETGNLRTYGQASLGWKSGGIFLIGGSMGALCALNYLRYHAANVSAVALIVPATNLEDLHDNHAGAYTSSIETAFTNNAGYLAALATHSPFHHPEAYDLGVPIFALISDDDSIAIASSSKAFIDAIPSATRMSLGNVGHTSTNSTVDIKAQVANFLHAHS